MHWHCEGLFSDHFLETRLANDSRGFDADLLPRLRALLNAFPDMTGRNEEDTERRIIDPLLQLLGWGFNTRARIAGPQTIPDFLLYPRPDVAEDAFQADDKWRDAVAILEAKRWGRNLASAEANGASPHRQIREYLAVLSSDRGIWWGILTNGIEWRLYCQHDRWNQYFALDLIGAHQANDVAALNVFLALFRADVVSPNSAGHRPIDDFRKESIAYREEVEAELRKRVFTAVEHLAKGYLSYPENGLHRDRDLPAIYEGALVLLYRVLFALNAEARNLLPVNGRDAKSDKYIARYSLAKIRDEMSSAIPAHYSASDTAALDDRLKSLFRLIDGKPPEQSNIPDPNLELDIPRYNGGLFSRERYPFLETHRVGDRDLALALELLFFVECRSGIDYASLGERHLGSVYEGLLEHTLFWDPEHNAPKLKNDKGERRTSGSYFTPDSLVRPLVRDTLQPLLDRIETEIGSAVRFDPAAKVPIPETEPDDRFAERVLHLKVVDPAMGSGHFLVEAIQVLAEAAATHPTTRLRPPAERPDAEPDAPSTFAYWKRRVAENCIFGVDLNPLSVELAKLSIWLKTVDRVPLNFLDHHLRCGDALLGPTFEHLGTFMTPYQSSQNRKDAPQIPLGFQQTVEESMRRVMAGLEQIEGVETDTRDTARLKESIWREIDQTSLPVLRDIANLWMAPWLVNADDAQRFARDYAEALDDPESAPARVAQYPGLRDWRAFAWDFEFPEVFFQPTGDRQSDPGFDAVIGNPPWERSDINENEFFAIRAPDIATLPTAAKRKAAIDELKTGEPNLYRTYIWHKDRVDRMRTFFQKSFVYPLTGKGRTNLYAAFAERASRLLNGTGQLGILVPSGISADASAAEFFRTFSETGRLSALFDFENRAIFPDVHRSFKFSMFRVVGRDHPPVAARVAFFLHDPEELKTADRVFTLTAEDFRRVNPNTGTAPVFRTARDARLVLDIYKRVPILIVKGQAVQGRTISSSNPWGVSFKQGDFNMSSDSHLFVTKEQLEAQGAYPVAGGVWKRAADEWVRLYEAKMIHQYDHRWSSTASSEQFRQSQSASQSVTLAEKANPRFIAQSRYLVERSTGIGTGVRLAYRDIARATDARTLISCLVPPVAAGHTLILVNSSHGLAKWSLVANFNSFVTDYVCRSKIAGTHLTYNYFEQLPILPPETYESLKFGGKTLGALVRPMVLELTYTADDMRPFAQEMGYDGDPFPWDEDRRHHLRCRLDALYFLAYGISDDDADYILSTFPIVKRQDEAAHGGRYRTRDRILAYMRAYRAGDTESTVAV